MSKVRVDTISTLDDQFHVDVLDLIHVREDISEIQSQGSSTWSLLNAPYPINAQVYHNGKQWLALRANSVQPVEGADWGAFGVGHTFTAQVFDANEIANQVGNKSGFYPYGSNLGSTNIPYPFVYIQHLFFENGNVIQIAYGFNIESTWIRNRMDGVWSLWTKQLSSNDMLQTTGTSTEFPMSQKAVTDTLGQPSITGSCTTNGTTDNTLVLTDIVAELGLEVGDVIRIQYTGYDKLHTVESITDANSIIVNYEHSGNRGNGSLKLADQTSSVTIKRIAKWYNAPIGLGQAWVNVTTFKSAKGVSFNSPYASRRICGVYVHRSDAVGSDAITVDDESMEIMTGGTGGGGLTAQYSRYFSHDTGGGAIQDVKELR